MPDPQTQDPLGYTSDQLAARIKEKLPQYKSIDNQKVVDSYLKLHPQYREHLIASPPKGAAPAATPPPPAKPAAAPSVPAEHESYFTDLSKASTQAMQSIQRWRPRWDDPKRMQQDPKWYDPSNPATGMMATGAMKAVVGGAVGGVKLLSDTMAALDPRELYQPTGKAQELGKEVYGIGKGILYDVPKSAYDIVRHFDQAAQNPEKLGNDLMNIAMTVDGGVKGAHAMAEHLFPDAATMTQEGVAKTAAQTNKMQAALTAQRIASNKATMDQIKWRAVADTYLHKNGVDVANELLKGDKGASDHVKLHAEHLDSKIPKTEGIDGYSLASQILKAHSDIVKTPDRADPVLLQLYHEAENMTPGNMPFDEARQFRSKVGAALQNARGANVAVLGRVYATLTDQLRDLSKKYGLGDSWDLYNELERKRQKSFPLLEKAKQVISENGEGVAMAQALKNEPAANEAVKSLSQYGTDAKKVARYRKNSQQILRTRPSENQRLTSYIYKWGPGTVPALAGMAVGKGMASAAGLGAEGWIAGLGLGAATGAAAVTLTEYLRAQRLKPQILDAITTGRKWPGKLVPSEGDFPSASEAGSGVAGPEPSGPVPTEPPPAAPTPSSGSPDVKMILPTQEALADAMVAKGFDPNFSDKRSKELLDQASGKGMYTGVERRMAPGLIAHYAGPERRGAFEPWRGSGQEGKELGVPSKPAGELPKPEISPEAKAISAATQWAESEKTQPKGGKRVIQPYEDIPKEPGPAQDAVIERIVEKPVQGLVKKLIAEGKKTLGSNAYGPGPKGVVWVDEKTGQQGFTALEGEGSRATKQRVRVAKVRAEKGSTAYGGGTQEISGGNVAEEVAKVQERLAKPNLDVSALSAVELEKQLQGLDKAKFKEAIDLRRQMQMTSEEYKQVLEFFYNEAMDAKLNRPAAD